MMHRPIYDDDVNELATVISRWLLFFDFAALLAVGALALAFTEDKRQQDQSNPKAKKAQERGGRR